MDTRIIKRLKDPSLREVLQMVSDVTSVSCYDILSNTSVRHVVKARSLFAYHSLSIGMYNNGDISRYLFKHQAGYCYFLLNKHALYIESDVVYKHRSSTLATMINNCYI